MKNGKVVYYYRFYDEEGNRTSGKSTGQTSKASARKYVNDLIKNGMLTTRKDITFGEYAKNWWVWDSCEYLKRQRSKGKQISQSYADISRGYLTRHILPYFKQKKLLSITARDIENWLMKLYDDEEKALSPSTINHCLTTLKIMLKEAHRLGYIPKNPAESVSQFSEKPKQKNILTPEEISSLFDEQNFKKIWNNDLKHYTINLLAASTGMRMGEIQALTVEAVHEDHIEISHAWERKYGAKEPKWKSYRAVPIPSKTYQKLQEVIQNNEYASPEDLVFYGNDKNKPIYHKTILQKLYKALEQIGIPREEQKRRNITFHSWRHFFNTVMRDKISDYKLQQLTGHKNQEMTDHYTQFNISDYQDVRQLQDSIFQ